MNIGALREVTTILKRMGIPYVIIGGVAAVYYDVPRMTFDIDILIPCLRESQARRLTRLLLKKDPSLNMKRVGGVLGKGGIIRVDWSGVTVVDFVVKKGVDPVMQRAVAVRGIKIISLEDLILLKLSVIRGTPPGQIRFQDRGDVEVLLAIHQKNLDLDYLKDEARKARTIRLLNQFLRKTRRKLRRA